MGTSTNSSRVSYKLISGKARGLWSTFLHVLLHSLHVALLLFVRTLLKAPFSRAALCYLGLRAIVAEADQNAAPGATVTADLDDVKHVAPLLPLRHENDSERLTIVLDLDETLVCAYNTEGLPASLHAAACRGGLQWFTMDCPSQEEDGDGARIAHSVTVYQRPGLKEFLASASQLGELVLFTAGLEAYARPLVDKIDPEGRISHRLYRPATVSTHFRDNVKDLCLLGRDLRRTLLVDNNPFSFLLQPSNGVPCVPFTGEDCNDRQLQEVLLPLLEELSRAPDVRPLLLSRFQMPSWFRIRGVPVVDHNAVIDTSTSSHEAGPQNTLPVVQAGASPSAPPLPAADPSPPAPIPILPVPPLLAASLRSTDVGRGREAGSGNNLAMPPVAIPTAAAYILRRPLLIKG